MPGIPQNARLLKLTKSIHVFRVVHGVRILNDVHFAEQTHLLLVQNDMKFVDTGQSVCYCIPDKILVFTAASLLKRLEAES